VTREFTAIIQKEAALYVSLCPEFDVAIQGASVEQARANLAKAVQLFLECASAGELARRTHAETCVTRVEVAVG
jgi:predicted RNase H-like HicB family nuclease